jgi:hypothetical protein
MATKREYHDASSDLYEASSDIGKVIELIKTGRLPAPDPSFLAGLEEARKTVTAAADGYYADWSAADR